MPIYAYKCESCGHTRDVLQKMSDAPLSDCPVCGAATFKKQLTAAGFQLKGSGWYATDFKGGSAPAPSESGTTAGAAGTADAKEAKTESKVSVDSGDSAAKSTAAPAASAGGCGSSCACH